MTAIKKLAFKKLVRHVGIFKAVVKGETYESAAKTYDVVKQTVKNCIHEITRLILEEHSRNPIAALKEKDVTQILDADSLLTELRRHPTEWCDAVDDYSSRLNIYTSHPRPVFPLIYGKSTNNLILPKEKVINALQVGFCDKFGLVGGDQLKIAFFVDGVEVDPKTVEVRTTF